MRATSYEPRPLYIANPSLAENVLIDSSDERHVRAEMPDAPRSIINPYHSTCPPFSPDLWTVRTIRIRKIYHAFEYPKLPLEPFFRDYTFVWRAVSGFNNYATRVEEEIVSWAFGIAKFRAEYFVTLETTLNEDECCSLKVGHGKS